MRRRHVISPGFDGNYQDLGISSFKGHDSTCNFILDNVVTLLVLLARQQADFTAEEQDVSRIAGLAHIQVRPPLDPGSGLEIPAICQGTGVWHGVFIPQSKLMPGCRFFLRVQVVDSAAAFDDYFT